MEHSRKNSAKDIVVSNNDVILWLAFLKFMAANGYLIIAIKPVGKTGREDYQPSTTTKFKWPAWRELNPHILIHSEKS